jgi:hypothetical protein
VTFGRRELVASWAGAGAGAGGAARLSRLDLLVERREGVLLWMLGELVDVSGGERDWGVYWCHGPFSENLSFWRVEEGEQHLRLVSNLILDASALRFSQSVSNVSAKGHFEVICDESGGCGCVSCESKVY